MRFIKNRKVILTVILLTVGIGIFLYFRTVNGAVKVEDLRLQNRVVEKTISSSGTLETQNDSLLSFVSSGVIQKVNYKKGDSVSAYAIVANLLNVEDYQTAFSAKNDRDSKLRDRDLFIEKYEDDKEAFGGNDEYAIELRRQNELVAKAEATYQAQLASVANTYLKSPIKGTVVDVYKDAGEMAIAGTAVVRVANMQTLVFKTDVDQEDFGYLKEGQEAEILLDAYKNSPLKGTVKRLPIADNEDTDEFTVEIAVADFNNLQLSLGLTGDVRIFVEKTKGEVSSFAFDEIFSDEKGTFAWAIENQKLFKKYIEIGLEGDLASEVKTNLSGVKTVMPLSGAELKEGMKAKIGS